MKTKQKKLISIVLAVLMAFTGILPAFTAAAADGVEGNYVIELFYKDTDTIIPTYIDETAEEKQAYIEYMHEGETLNLTYKLIDTVMPDNGYIKWYSETPTLVDVDQDGVVKAFDSSKGAVIRTWIDNEVKTIPLVGSLIASAIEKVLFNEYIDLDSMDTEEIINIVESAFGSDSPIAGWVDSYKGELIDSLRYYLDNINSNIHVQLYDADGTLLDDDYVQITVLKSEEWYSNFLPNGTHITNKSQINTTVAVGSTVQLYAVTTPLRLNYGVVYSIKSTSVFDQGKVVATVNDSGLVTFKNTGTVTVMVSPDTEQIIEGILKMVNYFYALDNTGTIDSDEIAGILIDYVGIDMNRTVLAALLDICFAVKDIVGETADPVQLTATAIEVIGNLVLQFVYNDTITFNVVEAQPLEDFSISGANTVREGSQIQMEITDIKPSTGDTSDITWSSSDPSIASVDPKTGVITGRDAGGSLGSLSTQTCTIYAVSAANNVQKSVTITVTGKTGRYLSDVEIVGTDTLEMGQETDYSYTVYPKRVAESDNLYVTWGVVNGTDEDGNPTYLWADSENPATDGIGTIDHLGHYVATEGGTCTIALKAQTGYYLSNGSFYEVSSFTRTFEVNNGVPIERIEITAAGATSNGTLNKVNTVTINDKDYTYVTVHKGVGEMYYGNGVVLTASIYPSNASNQTVHWVVDNGYYEPEVSEDTHTANVTQVMNHEVADTFNVYAVSDDGKIVSNTITVCVTRNYATSNVINESHIEVTRGYTADATHTIGFDGSWTDTAYACYKCNWYSSDESVFTVETKTNDNRDATITGVDVGTATLYCVSADGGITATATVTVYPDKEYLENIVALCDKTVIKRTTENRTLYNQYMRKLDLAYTVLYDQPMASQTTCDTYAKELLYAFYKLGGFVGIAGVDILGTNKTELSSDHVTVKVGTVENYTRKSYDFDYKITPSNAMYSEIEWKSSNEDLITVDKNGVCRPVSNDPCSSIITCTVTDYMGNETSDSVFVTFARTPATGVTLNTDRIEGGKIGETQTLTATVTPTPVGIVGGASCTNVYWSSSDESIAKVNQNGTVTFVAGGDCTIYCTTYDGGYTAQCAVNVVTNYTNLSLLVQQYTDLSLNEINYYPDTWAYFQSCMSEAKAMLEKGGYSQSEVDAMYTKLEDSYNSLQKYNYIQRVELYLDGEPTNEFYQYDLSFLKEGISYKNAVLDLNVRLYPNNGSYQSVKWESSTTDISVTSDGCCSPTIESSCYGLITCTVTDHYGNTFSDTVWVSFARYPVTSLGLSETSIAGAVGKTHQLTCTVYPTGSSLLHIGAASIQDFYWESDNTDIATVDENGLVTFVSAGATTVRAVSYDGGISAECKVSSQGDRTKLLQAIEDYKDVDYQDYEYDYGMAYKAAYESAQQALTDDTLTQSEIDSRTDDLINAYEIMVTHPFIKAQSINIAYTTYKRNLLNTSSQVAGGTIGSSDALSVDLSSSYSNYNNYNDVTLSATPEPSNAMYASVSWSVIESKDMDTTTGGSTITLTPKERNSGAWAKLNVVITDQYGRTVSRNVTVTMSDNVCTGFAITESSANVLATAAEYPIAYNLSGGEFGDIVWSSSDESVATVNASGVVTPIEKGTATITGKTLDGGYADTITINVQTDFSSLASKQSEYYELVESVKDSHTYTQESLDNLSAYISQAQTMINEGRATQAEVNALEASLEEAYNSLVLYVATEGLTIGYEENAKVSTVNEGYIRYTDSLLSSKVIYLTADVQPENSIYTSIKWTSSNPDITIDEQTGALTSTKGSAGVTQVTCTVENIRGESFTATAYVSFVRYGATGISFSEEKIFGAPAQTITLSPTITNSNNSILSSAVVKDCVYASDNPDVATVDQDGTVTFITQGSAVITATTLDGGYTASITAYTTWDTTALKAAIAEAEQITYTDYAYEYGMAFKSAYDHALTVYDNVEATQGEIDDACAALTVAISDLEAHPFIAPQITLLQNGAAVDDGGIIQVDPQTGNAVLAVSLNDGAMVKSVEIATADKNGAEAVIDGSQITVTKTADTGSLTVHVTVTDDYDRVTTASYQLSVIDQLIPVTSIALMANDTQISGSTYVYSCGGSYTKLDLTIGYIPTPDNANAITSVTYTSSAPNYVQIDENGSISLSTAGIIRSSNTATITCTVTNADGTTATAAVSLTITRA